MQIYALKVLLNTYKHHAASVGYFALLLVKLVVFIYMYFAIFA